MPLGNVHASLVFFFPRMAPEIEVDSIALS